jgi:hypothetical protein
MILLNTLFIFLFSFFLNAAELNLGKDIQKDWAKLQKGNGYFISDNKSDSPTLETIVSDLQIINVAATIDLSNSVYSGRLIGEWVVHKWEFDDSTLDAIYQLERTVAIDTVVTNKYLENRPPTRQQIKNNFTFHAYVISTKNKPIKFFYLTEKEQGLLEYKVGDRLVQINYAAKKEGISDILPQIQKELSFVVEEVTMY